MKLMEVLRLIQEQEPGLPPEQPELSPEAPPLDNIVEFPNQNFTVTLVPEEQRMIFVPQFHTSFTQNMKSYVLQLKKHFRIMHINNIDDESDNPDEHAMTSAFEVVVDPREDWAAVDSFLRKMADSELR